VEALPRLPAEWRAVLVGEGNGLGPLRARAESLGVGDRLITPGRLAHERVPDALAALDAVTWTQEPAYGLGRTTLKLPEYLACGKYVLASDAPMARELIRDNGRVLPYAGGHDLGYAQAMARTIAGLPRREELDRLGAAGVERAAPFGWDEVAARFCEAVESVGHELG
jgi:glycosyltransferase involved in cell wall biosynthesis